MIKIAFEVTDEDTEVCGLSMGHITIHIGENSISSDKNGSKSLMMLFLSIPNLLDVVRQAVTARKGRQFEFAGVDSSFSIWFVKQSDNDISLIHGDIKIVDVDIKQFCDELYRAVNNLWQYYSDFLNKDDMAISDMNSSLTEFKFTLQGLL